MYIYLFISITQAQTTNIKKPSLKFFDPSPFYFSVKVKTNKTKHPALISPKFTLTYPDVNSNMNPKLPFRPN